MIIVKVTLFKLKVMKSEVVIFVLAVMVVTVAAFKSHVLSDSFEEEFDAALARTRQLQ